jgi:tetratricopeptide (TPR) repeat protein
MIVAWVGITMLFAPLVSNADDASRGNRTKATAAMSQKVFKRLQEAQELADQENYPEVHELLEDLRGRRSLSVYETAQVWNYTAYTYYLQERYDEAINAYQQVLAQGELPDALAQSTLKTLSQLYFVVENYPQALASVNQLLAVTEEPAADVYLLLGQAHFQLKQFKEALQPIRTAIQIARKQGQRPKENWLLLLQVIYYELEDYPRMVAVLKELIQLYPKDRYLITLAAVYSQLGDTAKQLAITEVLYEKGYVKESHQIMNLANLYMLHGLPFKAGELLERELAAKRIEESENNLRLLSQAWHQAREDEKAIPPLEQAAVLAQQGELYVRLAQSYINLERWDDAVQALQKGLAKGGLRRSDSAHIMLGMALFNQNKFIQARTVFEKALTDKRSQKMAEEWLAHVESEIERQAFLQEEALVKPPAAQPPPS